MDEKTDANQSLAETNSNENHPLTIYLGKLLAACVGALIVVTSLMSSVENMIERQAEKFAILKGGRAFWSGFEEKLYKLADEPDIQPERKERVLEAVRKMSARYRPYLNALNESPSNVNPEKKDGTEPANELPVLFLPPK